MIRELPRFTIIDKTIQIGNRTLYEFYYYDKLVRIKRIDISLSKRFYSETAVHIEKKL